MPPQEVHGAAGPVIGAPAPGVPPEGVVELGSAVYGQAC